MLQAASSPSIIFLRAACHLDPIHPSVILHRTVPWRDTGAQVWILRGILLTSPRLHVPGISARLDVTAPFPLAILLRRHLRCRRPTLGAIRSQARRLPLSSPPSATTALPPASGDGGREEAAGSAEARAADGVWGWHLPVGRPFANAGRLPAHREPRPLLPGRLVGCEPGQQGIRASHVSVGTGPSVSVSPSTPVLATQALYSAWIRDT